MEPEQAAEAAAEEVAAPFSPRAAEAEAVEAEAEAAPPAEAEAPEAS
ncbi:hypothetical protein ACIBW9_33540 [Streptomyces sp. NPDC049541]